MKKILIILFCCVNFLAYGTVYYCSPADSGGNNANAGTIVAPWATFQYAFDHVTAGDTVYFRGGVYKRTTAISPSDPVGTPSNYIYFLAYPGETPIIDGSAITANGKYGIDLRDASYIKIKGIQIRKFEQSEGALNCYGFNIVRCNDLTLENCVITKIGGRAVYLYNSDSIFVINCDAFSNCDSLTLTAGDGFNTYFGTGYKTGYVYFKGCRAWNNSDDGWDVFDAGYIHIDSCWAFRSGPLSDGNGFKFGFILTDRDSMRRITNCISAYNESCGYHENSYGPTYGRMNAKIYHNISYKNNLGFVGRSTAVSPFLENENIYRNNISYDNTTLNTSFSGEAYWIHDHNSWDLSVTVTDADFVSVDSTGLTGARDADGSLPDLDFLKLVSTSDLIDVGTDVGLDYLNDAPDLGFYEYPTFPETSEPYINTNEPITPATRFAYGAGGNLIYAGGGTISAKGVCYSQEADPTTADSVIVCGTGTADFTTTIKPLTANTTYHVRAYATNETGTAYGADVEFTTPKQSYLQYQGKKVIINYK